MTDSKQEIRLKSTDLFLSLGFKSVTMDDIASEMGMSKKTLYSHYKNKEALVSDVTLHLYNNICCGIDHICETSTNPIEELYDIKRTVMDSLKGDKSSPIHQLQRYYPKVHHELRSKQFDYMQDCVNKNLEEGIEQGLYIPTINMDFVSRIYFVGIQGIKDLSVFPSDQFPVQDLYDQYLDYHLRGIVTPKGRKILNQITNKNHD
ncbi:MAG: TetR/AcrR family transcriptional regulator [Nonlabens sp.]